MFKCQICNKITKSGEKQNKKIIRTRKKVYKYADKNGKIKESQGTEIVKEINICDNCLRKENNNESKSIK